MPEPGSLTETENTDSAPTPGAGAAKRSGAASFASAEQLMELVTEQAFKCALTGRPLDPVANSHIDHIVPLSSGGGNEIENLQFLCKEANIAKGTLSNEDFIQLCRDVTERHEKA